MPHYFTREEAEALLPEITVVLRNIQQSRAILQEAEEELGTLRIQAMGNGHHLHAHIVRLQESVAEQLQTMRRLAAELDAFGCELKDPDMGLIDFLGLRNGREIYLCWYLGEERINYWHYIEAGFAGRQPF